MSLHSIEAGKMTYQGPCQHVRSRGARGDQGVSRPLRSIDMKMQLNTHKTILNVHTYLIRLFRFSTYDKVPDNAGDNNTKHDLSEILSTAYASCLQRDP
jgi:hypothetical protein